MPPRPAASSGPAEPRILVTMQLLPALVLSLSVLLLGSGCASSPTAQDWLDVGFDSPEQTLNTFRTGLRGNEPDLEYDSFSARFRADLGLSELAYLELRDEVFGRYPFLRKFVELDVVSEGSEGPRSHLLVVRLSAFFSERWVEVTFVRDDYYSVRSGDSILADDYAAFANMIASNDDRLVVLLETEEPIDPREVTHVVIGQEWKIDGFRTLEDDEIDALRATLEP